MTKLVQGRLCNRSQYYKIISEMCSDNPRDFCSCWWSARPDIKELLMKTEVILKSVQNYWTRSYLSPQSLQYGEVITHTTIQHNVNIQSSVLETGSRYWCNHVAEQHPTRSNETITKPLTLSLVISLPTVNHILCITNLLLLPLLWPVCVSQWFISSCYRFPSAENLMLLPHLFPLPQGPGWVLMWI